MLYRVTKQYGRGGETPVAQLDNIQAAKALIQEKLLEDARFKVRATYRLWEGMDLLREFTEADIIETRSSGSDSDQGGAGQGQRSRFQPTPFNATPRPPGSPPNWIKDDDEEDDGKK
ncbi:MAG TPA: hypothetical protein VLJ15_07895 [Gammaproteobacteria bacterium]|nr:hypothetical protein [Gammaproteobacteria bacterium]